MKKMINWGILGAGHIAEKFAQDLQHVEGGQLYAVSSRSLSKAQGFAKQYNGLNAFGSYEDMLKDPKLDVVYVATPNVFHKEHSILCMRHRKAVLCEKPFAMNRSEVEEMINVAKEENVFLMEAFWTQFLPHFKFVMELLASQKYGKIRSLKADFGFAAAFSPNSRLFDKKLGGGSLLDIGIYPVFMALSALGYPEKINAQAKMSSTGVDENCDIQFTYSDGAIANLHSNLTKETETAAIIELEQATLKLNRQFHGPTSIIIIVDGKEELIEFDVTCNGYKFETEHVQEMLLANSKESNVMSFEKSLQLIDLLDIIRDRIGLAYN